MGIQFSFSSTEWAKKIKPLYCMLYRRQFWTNYRHAPRSQTQYARLLPKASHTLMLSQSETILCLLLCINFQSTLMYNHFITVCHFSR